MSPEIIQVGVYLYGGLALLLIVVLLRDLARLIRGQRVSRTFWLELVITVVCVVIAILIVLFVVVYTLANRR